MNCRLCDRNSKFAEAHLIPRWAFKSLNPHDRSTGEPLLILSKTYPRRTPTGVWDNGILCQTCDKFIGRFDDYGKEIFQERSLLDLGDNVQGYIIGSVDTIKVRVFLLSVLWRCSISSRKEVFYVDLGQYEEKIKGILRKAMAGINFEPDLNEFTILIAKFGQGLLLKDVVDRTMACPMPSRLKNGVNYHAIYLPRGFKIFVKTDKRPFPDAFVKLQVKGDKLLILKWKNFQDSHEFAWMAETIRAR